MDEYFENTDEYTEEYTDEFYEETEPVITEEPAEPTYYSYYIQTDAQDRVTATISSGPIRNIPTDAILLTDMGVNYQYTQDGVENPSLTTDDDIYLYRWDGSTIIPRTPEELEGDRIPPLQQLQQAKLAAIGQTAQDAIYNGVEVDGKHYSLTDHDQIELMAQQAAVMAGAAEVPYHADGELCRMYTAAEFLPIATNATGHIFFHRTYCNHLNTWIRRCGTVEELDAIEYTGRVEDLPPDLAEHMAGLIGGIS